MKRILLPLIFGFAILFSNQNSQAISIKSNHLRIAGLIAGSVLSSISIHDTYYRIPPNIRNKWDFKAGFINGALLGLGLGILVSTAASLTQN